MMRPMLAAILLSIPLLAPGAQASERLQLPQLSGWRIVSNVTDKAGESTDLIPLGDMPESWTRRVTIQAFRSVEMTVSGFLDRVVGKTGEVCDNAAAGQPSLGKVSGLEAGSRAVACGRYKGDGKGSYTLYYVIRGREAFYVLSRAWRVEPFATGITPVSAEDVQEWAAYVRGVEICDTKVNCR